MYKRQQVYAVTGSAGFLGRYFLTDFAKHFPNARVILLLNSTSPASIPRDWETCLAPLNDGEALARALNGVTTLIHFAGVTHADSKNEYWLANALGTKNLVRAAEKNMVRKIIYISTRAIGSECGDYGGSKHEAELCITGSNIPFVIFRLSEIYGAGSSEGINGLIKLVRRLPIVPYPRGISSFAPLFLDDAIRAIMVCLCGDNDIYNSTYTLAGPDSYTFPELVKVISRVSKLKRLVLPLPQILFRILITTGKKMHRPFLRYDQLARMICSKDDDISRARADLGFQPRSFEDGLKSLIY